MTNRKYASSHEWVVVDGDGIATIGISDYAQESLGDIVFVELPDVGKAVAAGDEIALVESVKAASDIYSPVSGEVVETNDTLADAPETINSSAMESGWLYKLKLSAPDELDGLLDENAYAAECD